MNFFRFIYNYLPIIRVKKAQMPDSQDNNFLLLSIILIRKLSLRFIRLIGYLLFAVLNRTF